MNLREATGLLYTVLIAAQTERGQRPDLVDGPDGPECAWAAFERSQMHQAVNEIRAAHGMQPVHLDDVIMAERQAAGHCDYTRKFAFYCAEITRWSPE
jgi:hypothetical protein